jgi:hypothetical protein
MFKLVSIISVVLLGSVVVARGQQISSTTLSDADKTRIIESVLDLDLRNQNSVADFDSLKHGTSVPFLVSSENIEFIEPSLLSKHGFTLVAANQLRELQTKRVVKYLLFKQIFVGDDVVEVALSHVTAGRACFNDRFYFERSYRYEARRTPGGWTVVPPFFWGLKGSNATRETP